MESILTLPKELILTLVKWILTLPNEWAVTLVGMLPIFELRGAIPLGFVLKMPLYKILLFSIIGNLIPVIPLLLFLQPVSETLRRFIIWRRFFEWLFERTRKKAAIVEKYEAIGLALFVSIPLPVTGAWTGTVAACLFKIKFKYALLAIALGVLIASVIVTLLCILGKISWGIMIR